MKLDFMQTTAAANSVILQIYLRRIYNVRSKIKYEIYVASGNEMGGACGAYGGGQRCAQGSSGET